MNIGIKEKHDQLKTTINNHQMVFLKFRQSKLCLLVSVILKFSVNLS